MTQSYAASRKKSSILYVVYQIQLFSNCNSLNVARRTRNRDGWPSQPILCFFYPLRTVLLEAFVSTETASNAVPKNHKAAFPCAYAATDGPKSIPPRNEYGRMARQAVTCGSMSLEIAVSRCAQRSWRFPYAFNSHIAKRIVCTYRLAIAEFGLQVARF
ncbi:MULTISPECIES: hypothetical protein [Paraburkholderia]|jgi:hypothetical protein|uniref:hypothetical protein n=1 Tax=Paraburkholderia TaxID=1822464 RepID=UPI0015DAF1E7|nr:MULTISPECIES: hypothetical protein [Paraburkholderia]